MAADNSAYDYFLQDNPHRPDNENSSNAAEEYIPAEKPEAVRVSNITMKKTPPKRGSVVKVFFAALLALFVLFVVIYGRVETNRLYRQISDQNQMLENAQRENSRLKSELEGKMTLKNVEEYAEKVLGLQKLDNSQIRYVQTQTDDIVEIPDEDKSLFTKIKEKFNGFLEYIFG